MIKSYTIDLDGKCNQRCLFCMKSEDIEKGKKITFDDVIKQIAKAKLGGYEAIDFFGGEPTTYDFLPKAAELVQKNGMQVGLATNAILFASKKYAENFFRNLDDDKIFCLRTSMHGTEEAHNRLVQTPNAYKNLLKGIQNILGHCEKLTVNIVITSLNYKQLSELVGILYDVGVRAIKFSGINNVGRSRQNEWLMVDDKEIEKYLKSAIRKCEKLNFKFIEIINMPDFWLKNKDKFKKLRYDEIS